MNDRIELDDLLELYWNYYQLHAEQRMKLLELFIIAETALIGGFFAFFEKNEWISCVIGLAISVVACVCLVLDRRTTDLLHNCRKALRKFEELYLKDYNKDLMLFTRVKKSEGRFNYSKAIRSVYILMIVMGFIPVFIRCITLVISLFS